MHRAGHLFLQLVVLQDIGREHQVAAVAVPRPEAHRSQVGRPEPPQTARARHAHSLRGHPPPTTLADASGRGRRYPSP